MRILTPKNDIIIKWDISVYLSGPYSDVWRDQIINQFKGVDNVVFLNSYLKNFDIHDTESQSFEYYVEWCTEARKQAHIVVFYFDETQDCDMTLYEFGACIETSDKIEQDIVVYTPESYKNYNFIKAKCEEVKAILHTNINDIFSSINYLLG